MLGGAAPAGSRRHTARQLAARLGADKPPSAPRGRELALDPVEVQVDLPLVVATEADPEDDVVHLLGGNGARRWVAGQRRLHPVEKASTSSTL
jgi:hypothetical protein